MFTPETLKAWGITNKELAMASLAARAMAELDRERVDAYLAPIFARCNFVCEDTGEKITDQKQMYLVADLEAPEVLGFYAACDKAHKDNGYKDLDPGYCPATMAENLQMEAERELLFSLGALMGIGERLNETYGKDRTKALDLALTACLGTINV